MYEIEKNVPIPESHKGKGRPICELTKVLMAMDVGDCVRVDRKQKQLGSYIFSLGKKGLKLTTRKDGDGTRIWRVA